MKNQNEAKHVPVLYYYVRTSGEKSIIDSEVQMLDKATATLNMGKPIIITETTGKTSEKPEFEALMERLNSDDVIAVTSLTRIEREKQKLNEIKAAITSKGAKLFVVEE